MALFAAALSLAMIGAGVFGGAVSAFQVSDSQPDTPDSASVGTSGTVPTRCLVATARIRALPDLCNSSDVASSVNIRSTWLAIRSLSAGPVPLYGTWTSLVWVIDSNRAAVRCDVVPGPCDA